MILQVAHDSGYGTWMSGYVPDGDTVAALYEIHAPPSEPSHQYLRGMPGDDEAVRASYSRLLGMKFEEFYPKENPSGLLLLHPMENERTHPGLYDLLGLGERYHVVLASREDIGGEFFQLIQRDYGFTQESPYTIRGPPEFSPEVWDQSGKRLPPIDPDHAAALVASTALVEFVDMINNPDAAILRLFERLGLSED